MRGLGLRSPTVFCSLLALASSLPFLVALLVSKRVLPVEQAEYLLIFPLAGLATAHVPSTALLLVDPVTRRRVASEPMRLVLVPALFVAAFLWVFAYLPAPGLAVALVAFVMFQAWHFGMQNIGVFAFGRLATRSGAMSRLERSTIMVTALCGVAGAYWDFRPTFLTPLQLPTPTLELPGHVAYVVGGVVYAVNIVVAVLHLCVRRERFNALTALLYLISIGFYLPIYLLDFRLHSVGSYVVAHGCQYQVFMYYVALGQAPLETRVEPSIARKLSFVVLLTIINVVGYLWVNHPGFLESVTSNVTSLVKYTPSARELVAVGVGIHFGLAVAHFWIDGALWRLRDPERLAWARSRYAFLFPVSA